MIDLQALVDGMGMKMQEERSHSQMTLGKMIERLESLPMNLTIDGIKQPHSYRGYYCDLAFEPSSKRISVKNALKLCRSALGEVYTGYKGGEYQMGKLTPVWIAHYGSCGSKIMAIGDNGAIAVNNDED